MLPAHAARAVLSEAYVTSCHLASNAVSVLSPYFNHK